MARIKIGDRVYDHVDPRHVGKVEAILRGVAFIRWQWCGLASLLPVHTLRRKTCPAQSKIG